MKHKKGARFAFTKSKKIQSTNEFSNVKSSFTYTVSKKARIRNTVPKESSKRIYTPIEAEKEKARQLGIAPDINMSTRSNMQFKRAKRTLTLKPAPKPFAAPKSKAAIMLYNLRTNIRSQIKKLDYFLIFIIFVLFTVGIFAVHSATLSMNTTRYDFVQIAMCVVGVPIMFLISFIDYDAILKHWKKIFIVNIVLLVITVIFGTGTSEAVTNKNWLELGPIRFQPAELAKIMFILTFAVHLDKVKGKINSPKYFFGLLMHGGLIIGLILLQKDLGQALVFAVIFAAMLFAAKLKVWYFLAGGAMLFAALPFVWSVLSDYQKKRILVGFNPEIDPLHMGWQVIKSKTAIAAGGIFGSGYTQGIVSQSDALPAKHTDMIFAVIAEEAGLIGAVFVLAFLFALILRVLYISSMSYEMTGYYICTGIAAMLIFQTIENIGMCMGFLPVIGITLPFISAGGSSLLNLFFTMGIVLSIYTKRDTLYF